MLLLRTVVQFVLIAAICWVLAGTIGQWGRDRYEHQVPNYGGHYR